MIATTLGDLFPDMRKAVPEQKHPRKPTRKKTSFTTSKGTAARIKQLYPEIESWNPVLATKAWVQWCELNEIKDSEPKERDERFPEYPVRLIREKMTEMNEWR